MELGNRVKNKTKEVEADVKFSLELRVASECAPKVTRYEVCKRVGEVGCEKNVYRADEVGVHQATRRERSEGTKEDEQEVEVEVVRRAQRRQREKGRQEYRGERATRYVTLNLTWGTKCKKQQTQRGRRRGNCLKGRVEGDAAKYSREHANRDVRLRRRGRAKQRAGHRQTRGGEAIGWKAGWTCSRGGCGEIQQRACKTRGQNQRETGRERRAQSTRVGLGCGNCLEVRAGVGAGKGEEVRGTPEGVRGAGDINWRERGGGWVGASPQKKTYVGFPEMKGRRADPDALSAAVLAGVTKTTSPRRPKTRDHVGLPGAWVDTRRYHSDRCQDDRDEGRERKGGVHKWGESAAQRGAVVQSEMLGGTRWKRVGWGRVRVAGENPSGSSAEWSAQVGATQSGVLGGKKPLARRQAGQSSEGGVLGGSAGNGRMRKPIRGVMVMVMVRVGYGYGYGYGGGKGGQRKGGKVQRGVVGGRRGT
ncbi:hypothetical protein PMAC_001661, partial [Pneumocystis sp. 'macacae']